MSYLKIIKFEAENIKRLACVEISPAGNMVHITGKNAQGKTSILDAISWALDGAAGVQAQPIRTGHKKGFIRLDLGEIIVTRTFNLLDDGQTVTKITVENKDGFASKSPQKLLDALVGKLTFDPLAFARMEPKKQFDQLRAFVPGVNFEEIARAQKADFERRTDINRQAKEARAAGACIVVPDGLPDFIADEASLVADMERAGQANSELAMRAERRRQSAEKVDALTAEAARLEAALPALILSYEATAIKLIDRLDEQIDDLDERLVTLRARRAEAVTDCEGDVAEAKDKTAREAEIKRAEATELQARIDTAGPLPEPIDTAALRTAIVAARATNEGISARKERQRQLIRAEELEATSAALTTAMEKRAAEKKASIAAAELPVPGIGFGDGGILLNDLPFEQASSAQRIEASARIAMALNPRLRVMTVRDGALLDDDTLAVLTAVVAERDYQCWMESISSEGRPGVVMVEGRAQMQMSMLEAAE